MISRRQTAGKRKRRRPTRQGPKVSSFVMIMLVVTSVSTVARKNGAAEGGALAAGYNLGAFLDGVGDVCLDLFDRLRLDQWPDYCARIEQKLAKIAGDAHLNRRRLLHGSACLPKRD
jgi:hypothetical protein